MAILRDYLRNTHLAGLFAIQGEAATYTPAGGDAVDITVIVRQPDEIQDVLTGTRVWAETTLFEVRVSEVAAPQVGDTLVHDGVTYVVKEKPERRDALRLLWVLNVRRSG